jgi:hypothetical protein
MLQKIFKKADVKSMTSVKKVVYFLLPASLLAFIFFQNFAPLLEKTAAIVQQAEAAPPVKPKPAEKKTEQPLDPGKIKAGIYYTYKADYSCPNPKDPDGPPIPSHFDSYGIEDGKICHMGDICNNSYTCGARLPVGMKLGEDKKSLVLNGRTFRLQKTPYPPGCQMPSCSPPPGNCSYSVGAPLDEKGCALGCGGMLCKTDPGKCPDIECAVPPANCFYDGMATRDANNCPISCGKLVCDIVGDEVACPGIECAPAPENCRYDRHFKKDSKGCKTTCGNLVCEKPTVDKPVCPQIECASPPPGCNYEGEIPRDQDGCMTSCGSLSCVKNTPAKCKVPQCEPPPANCRYDGNSPLDFDGCADGCGNLVCNKEEPVSL